STWLTITTGPSHAFATFAISASLRRYPGSERLSTGGCMRPMIPTTPRSALIMVRMLRMRPYSWLLVFLLSLTAVLGSQLRGGEPQLMHVADGPPPIEAPTGALLDAFESARAATVRIEARCGSGRGVTYGVGTGFFVSEDGLLLTANHVIDSSSSSC